ncbi:hypothetical protein Suden_0027 [Sulfurimonas denitrificans DSM 1251]|uniref:Uncharacterized protein n=1 Tax=Sulfurimonas denitrificans (strain ATCC 33889 / DSM 1251) TaxID=326298 RepID=Q30UM3_SULDN|nr:hypothetical protein [Sulfurimonas denitrificans]ABB43308.1 hypothetical protein Suden_0027 [Sulfurimonas denitrificans DSM 1251]MDD3443345.1 hypothetical protein [Sulfurimonas denitrificans]
MAGVHFGFNNFKQLLDLTIGLVQRIDENRAESFTILYCDFSALDHSIVKSSLEHILRNSDAIVNDKADYFFVLPYTDKYGAEIVKKMFIEFFAADLKTYMVSYPIDGENSEDLVFRIRDYATLYHKNDLNCLDSFNRY